MVSLSLKGTASSNDQSTLDPALKRLALTSTLLGKRKASAPAAEQPEPKRSVAATPREEVKDHELPSTSVSGSSAHTPAQSTSVDMPKGEGIDQDNNSTQFGRGDGKPLSSTSDSPKAAVTESTPTASVQHNSPEPEVVLLDDDDSFDEIDMCEAPLPETPKKYAQITGTNASPATSASSSSSPVTSTPSKDKTPLRLANKSPPTFNKNVSTSSGSPHHVGFSARAEIKSSNPVPCHYCPKTGCQLAVKTCLVCGASMCTEHLRPHLESPVFKSHTLVPPVEDISSWRCQEHHEINRIYCRPCAVCVCTVCTVIGSHRNHVCISIREAERELRVGTDCTCTKFYPLFLLLDSLFKRCVP